MTFQQFRDKYNDKFVDTDGAFGNQCMDLMHAYIVEVLGLPLSLFAAPTACLAYLSANDQRFIKTDNTPTGVPQNGDIIFWNTTIGSAGHVAIFVDGNVNSFNSFDQNFPVGSPCHIQNHTYNGVAGWLHFSDLQAQLNQAVKDRDFNYNCFKALCDALGVGIVNDDKEKAKNDALDKISTFEGVIQKVIQLQGKIQKAQGDLA